jgi:hypothetical protein
MERQKHYVIVDWVSLVASLLALGLEVTPKQIARLLKDLTLFLGGELVLIAILAADDQGARRAFRDEQYRVELVDNDRRDLIDELHAQIEDQVDRETRVYLTLASDDNAFGPLLRTLIRHKQEVRVLGTARNAGPELRRRECNFLSLDRMLRDSRRKRLAMLIDAENIVYSLKQRGLAVSIPQLAQAARASAERYGQLQWMIAAADWRVMAQSLGVDAQRQFEEQRVETLYEIAKKGGNSSDMRLVGKAHELLQASEAPDVFILQTGDRDFTHLVEAIKRAGKRVIIWGVRGSMSQRMLEIADETEWVDEILGLGHGPAGDCGKPAALPAGTGLDPLVALAIVGESLSQVHGMPWVSPGRLLDAMAPGQVDTEARAAAKQVLARARAEGVLNGEQRPNPRPDAARPTIEALTLNLAHPKVKEARLLIERTRALLRAALGRLPFAAFSYVAGLLERDPDLARAGLVRSRAEQMQLLNLLVEVGLLHKERRTTPYECAALLLPPERPAPAAVDDHETMLRRVVSGADAWMAQRGLDWAPVKALSQRLGGFGQDVFRETLDRLTQSAEAEQRRHENLHGPYPVLGLHLDPQGASVAAVRQERERILAAAQSTAQSLTVEQLHASVGERMTRAQCERWLAVLADEGALARQGGGYVANLAHPLLRGLGSGGAKSVEGEVIDVGGVCELLAEALTDEEITLLIHSYFPKVADQLAEGMNKLRKVALLFEHARKRQQVTYLIERASKYNPRIAQVALQRSA